MAPKQQYKTKQRGVLLDYLATIPGLHFTVSDLCDHFQRENLGMAQSTIYRQLEKLVSEGLVNKYSFDSKSPACFEFIGEACRSGEEVCFHCKCEKCGKLIHLHCNELEDIQQHLQAEHHFQLDPLRTVFYGICENCKGGVPKA